MQALADKMDQVPVVSGPKTFIQASQEYMEMKENVLSPSTIRGYASIVRNISDSFNYHRISDITVIDIQKEVNNYSASHSAKSTSNLSGFISAVLGAHRPDFHFNVSLPQKKPSDDYIPTDEEVKSILALAKGTVYEIPLWLCISGMRKSEVCAISKSDLEGDMLHITKSYVQDKDNNWILKDYPKNVTSNRTIKLLPQVAKLIQEAPTKPEERIYQGFPNQIYYALKRYQRQLGIQEFRLHTCRAYYISLCHAMGIPDQYIMANTGHKTDHTLKAVYRRTKSDTQKEMDEKILAKLNDFFE